MELAPFLFTYFSLAVPVSQGMHYMSLAKIGPSVQTSGLHPWEGQQSCGLNCNSTTIENLCNSFHSCMEGAMDPICHGTHSICPLCTSSNPLHSPLHLLWHMHAQLHATALHLWSDQCQIKVRLTQTWFPCQVVLTVYFLSIYLIPLLTMMGNCLFLV